MLCHQWLLAIHQDIIKAAAKKTCPILWWLIVNILSGKMSWLFVMQMPTFFVYAIYEASNEYTDTRALCPCLN